MKPNTESRKVVVSPARAAAFDILLRVESEVSYASELLHSRAFSSLSLTDHGLATELVMGVLRWRSRLDDEIFRQSSQPVSRLDLEVLTSLRLAVYQLRWLSRIPARAAVHESVELVKRARKRSAAPFVNAVLRRIAAISSQPSSRETDPAASPSVLSCDYAHPLWMVERWTNQYGLAAAERICGYDQSVPVTTIRTRSIEIEKELAAEGVVLSPGALLAKARRVQSGDLTNTRAFHKGRVAIQDEASQLVATLAGGGSRILDCCAAPGGKTRAIAEENPDATIIAIEIHSHRARLLKRLLQAHEQPTGEVQVVVADARNLPTRSCFDRVLADVPCSGTGTLARNPEIKWRLDAGHLLELQKLQLEILNSALKHLAPGGRLIYSTCSLEKEENEDVIEQALAANLNIRALDCERELIRLRKNGELTYSDPNSLSQGPYLRTIPGLLPCDGFFAAILERP